MRKRANNFHFYSELYQTLDWNWNAFKLLISRMVLMLVTPMPFNNILFTPKMYSQRMLQTTQVMKYLLLFFEFWILNVNPNIILFVRSKSCSSFKMDQLQCYFHVLLIFEQWNNSLATYIYSRDLKLFYDVYLSVKSI